MTIPAAPRSPARLSKEPPAGGQRTGAIGPAFPDAPTEQLHSGWVTLRSGTWDWILYEQSLGATIIYRHRDRFLEEMRTWTPAHQVTREEAREAALDPVYRTWADDLGVQWRVSLEFPSLRPRAGAPARAAGEALWLVFESNGIRRQTTVAAGTQLGDLAAMELGRLLRGAS